MATMTIHELRMFDEALQRLRVAAKRGTISLSTDNTHFELSPDLTEAEQDKQLQPMRALVKKLRTVARILDGHVAGLLTVEADPEVEFPARQDLKQVGAKILEERRRMGFGITELSEASLINIPRLGSIEQGIAIPSADELQRIASALGIEESDLESDNKTTSAWWRSFAALSDVGRLVGFLRFKEGENRGREMRLKLLLSESCYMVLDQMGTDGSDQLGRGFASVDHDGAGLIYAGIGAPRRCVDLDEWLDLALTEAFELVGEGGMLVVPSLDRLSANPHQRAVVFAELREMGAGFVDIESGMGFPAGDTTPGFKVFRDGEFHPCAVVGDPV